MQTTPALSAVSAIIKNQSVDQLPPAVLPMTGFSRWSSLKKFIPFSREKWRQLCAAGRAPRPIRDGLRMTYYRNEEIHRFLADPINYRDGE